MEEEQVVKAGLIQWYDSKRNKMFFVTIILSLIVCCLFFVSNKFNLEVGFIIGRLGKPEYKDFYENYMGEWLDSAIAANVTVMVIAFILFLIARSDFDSRQRCGVWFYNIALIAQAYALGKYVFTMVYLYKRLPYVAIFYIAVVVYLLFVLVLNAIHYKKNKDTFGEVGYYGVFLFFIVVLCLILVALSMTATVGVKERLEEGEQKYAANEFGDMYEVLWVEADETINEDPRGFVGLWYVNLFNDRGKEYTAEELEEAIYNVYYNTGSWYAMKEFNQDCRAIEEAYDLRQYSYDEDAEYQEGYEVFYQLVYRTLRFKGMELISKSGIPSYEDKYDACVHVYEMLSSGKPMEEIGESGDVITVTYAGKIKDGEKAVFTLDSDTELTYPVVSKWNRVAYVGATDEIERYFPHGKSELTFQDGKAYKADLTIYPEITYEFNENLQVKVEGIDYEKIEYTVYDECIVIELWFILGDDASFTEVKEIDSVAIEEIDGMSHGDSVADRNTAEIVTLRDDSVVCSSLLWQYYKFSDGWRDYYSYCNPNSDNSSSVKYFTTDIPAFAAELELYTDTGYIFGEAPTVEYNSQPLTLAEDTNADLAMPILDIVGHYRVKGEGHITAQINFYRIRVEAEHGTVEQSVNFAATGTTVTLNPIPDKGYKFVGYETSTDLENPDGRKGPAVIDDEFEMLPYPVVIRAMFVKE